MMKDDYEKYEINDDFDLEKDFGGLSFSDDPEIPDADGTDLKDPEEVYARGGKKKKKRKKKRYLLKFFIFLLIVAGFFAFLRSDFFTIEKVNVLYSNHYTSEQIMKKTGLKVGDNLFEFTIKSLDKKLTEDPYIKTVEIKRILPNALEIKVTERTEQVVIPYGNKFIISDYDGMVLRIADKAPDLTVINNLKPVKPTPGTALEVSETELLADTLALLKEVESVDLYFKKISISQHSMRAYIYDNLVVEGSYENIKDNLSNLMKVVSNLHKDKIKRGTIKVSGNGYCVLQPAVNTKQT